MSQLNPESEIANRFQLVSRMADDLAHEIKNPLNSMVINLEVIRSRARKGDAAGVLDRADVVESEVRRLNGLIDGMLKLLRPERLGSDQIPLDPVLSELGELVGLQAKLARKELTVALLGSAAVTRGRRDAVRFALLNLIAAELDGVTGDAARVDIGGSVGSEATLVFITATSAMAPAHPIGASSTPIDMARSLLQPMGGRVEIADESTEKGTDRRLTVHLPLARPA
jgi:phosphoglycerate-specific signal transduction histidine kinase